MNNTFSPMSFLLKAYHSFVPPRIDRQIARALALPQAGFPKSVHLPVPYGKGMSERVVEILIARLTYQPGRKVLDVGHANIMNAHIRMLKSLERPYDVTGIDIAEPTDEIRPLYTASLLGDITKTGLPEGSFDLIWCISALEHFGMDNSVYLDTFTLDKTMDVKALEEMLRITRNGGTIFVSVPYGKFEDHGWLKNYDRENWQKLLAVARPVARIDELYFKYSDAQGWRPAEAAELAGTGYLDHTNGGASGLAAVLIHKNA